MSGGAKTLLILRHGQAAASPTTDKSRALTEQGERDARARGRQVLARFGCPGLIVSSDATRAQQTADAVAAATGYTEAITTREEIYEADVNTLLSLVQAMPGTAELALLVGHNPGLERLVWALDAQALTPLPLPTAGLAPVQFDAARWADVRPRSGLRLPFPISEHQHTDKGT